MIIELTNICNLKCIMCPSPLQTRARGYMTLDVFERIISDPRSKLELIDFALYGEVLLHPSFEDFIKLAKSRKIRTTVSTNASFLTTDKSTRLINSGLDFLTISIDEIGDKEYREIRVGNELQDIIKKVKGFIELNQGRVFTCIQKVHMQPNKNATWNYIKEMSGFGANLIRLKTYRDIDTTKTHLRVENNDDSSDICCPYLWKSPVVNWEGELVPCCIDYDSTMKLGNLNKIDYTAGWNGRQMNDIRLLHAKGKKNTIPLCKDCSSINIGFFTIIASSLLDSLNLLRVLAFLQTTKVLFKTIK